MHILKAGIRQFATLLFCLVLLSVNAGPACSQTAEPAPVLQVVEAGPFRVHLHVGNEEVAEQVRRVTEQTWEVASGLYRSDAPAKKYDVHLYRNADGYVAAEHKLTGGAFKRNLAFAHFDTLSAHVALQPTISDRLLKKIGLPKQSARLLAHEMAHLVRFARMPNTFEDHPDWLADGIASHIDHRVLTATGYTEGPMHDPNFGSYVSRGKQLLNDGKLPTAEQMLDDSLDLEFHQRYSVRWLFVDMLVTSHKDQFYSFLQELRRLGGGSTFVRRSKDLLLKHLAVDVKTLDQNFRDHVKQLKPNWVESFRLLETHGPVWDQLAFPDSTATSWNQSALGDSFVISTNVTIHDVGGKQMNIRIGQPDSFTQFSITAGYGLNVFHFSNGKWETKVAKKIDGIKTGEPLKLELSYDKEKKESVVTLNGERVFAGPMDRLSKDQFALGAQDGSAIAWGDLKVEQ